MTQVVDYQTKEHARRPRMQEAGLLVVILLLGIFLWCFAPIVRGENGFLRPDNLIPSVLTPMSWMAIMAVGATAVIISGGIDISVGSVFGLSALGTVAVLQNFPDHAAISFRLLWLIPVHIPGAWSAWVIVPLGILVPLAIGGLCGFINGALVVGLRMHPFIVTLATLSIFRWGSLRFVKEGSLPAPDKSLPTAFTDHFISYTLPLNPVQWGWPWKPAAWLWDQWVQKSTSVQPVPMLIMLAVVVLGWVYLRQMVWGREVYAVGGNEEAARFSGLRVHWVKLRVYIFAGLTAGLAGMVSSGYFKAAAINTGEGYELVVIASAVVGGASLLGGRGTAMGAWLGTLVLGLINNGIAILGHINLGVVVIPVEQVDFEADQRTGDPGGGCRGPAFGVCCTTSPDGRRRPEIGRRRGGVNPVALSGGQDT